MSSYLPVALDSACSPCTSATHLLRAKDHGVRSRGCVEMFLFLLALLLLPPLLLRLRLGLLFQLLCQFLPRSVANDSIGDNCVARCVINAEIDIISGNTLLCLIILVCVYPLTKAELVIIFFSSIVFSIAS